MKKLYYTIGEVSKISDLEPHVLRYWETIFDDLQPAKSKAGKRTYTQDDIDVVLKLRELIYEKKYSTAGAREILQNGQQELEANAPEIPLDVKRDMKEIRIFLNQLLEQL